MQLFPLLVTKGKLWGFYTNYNATWLSGMSSKCRGLAKTTEKWNNHTPLDVQSQYAYMIGYKNSETKTEHKRNYMQFAREKIVLVWAWDTYEEDSNMKCQSPTMDGTYGRGKPGRHGTKRLMLLREIKDQTDWQGLSINDSSVKVRFLEI